MKKTLNQKAFGKLVRQYLSGKVNESGRRAIEQYYDLFATEEDILEDKDKEEIRNIGLRLKSGIDLRISEPLNKVYPLWRKFTIAVALLIAMSAGLYFYMVERGGTMIAIGRRPNEADIISGGNRAVLSLSDGTRILLDNAQNGLLARQQGIKISKAASGILVYATGVGARSAELLNSVSTPRGGQYRLRLSDGTQVWLNAGSILTYPVAFSGDSRQVKLSGEAYFEVTRDSKRPFRVYTVHQKICVKGTHFNISAYNDDSETRTTLLEGSVVVTDLASIGTKVLYPGQQALSLNNGKNNSLIITNIDTAEAVAWKNGYFQFQDESLQNVLKKIARWYDLDINYVENRIPQDIYFSGTVSKYYNAGQVLRKLELSGGVHFHIEGRRIMVKP
jgi:transmembrane sensor